LSSSEILEVLEAFDKLMYKYHSDAYQKTVKKCYVIIYFLNKTEEKNILPAGENRFGIQFFQLQH
jgi:hypothetical protein